MPLRGSELRRVVQEVVERYGSVGGTRIFYFLCLCYGVSFLILYLFFL